MDPNLVRGKKCKKEDEPKSDKMFETFDPEEEEAMEDDQKYENPTNSQEPEEILKYRAGVLNYQGSWLHYQASILEERAQKARAEASYVPTICYSNPYPNQSYHYRQYQRSHEQLNHLTYQKELENDHSSANIEEESNHSYEDETPLDLTVKKDHLQVTHHTQSQHMPRIFFSVGSK